jgi:hypothetical protein
MSGRDPNAVIPDGFQCPHAERGQRACPAWRCDCFVATHPEDPFGFHPEDFVVEDFGVTVRKVDRIDTDPASRAVKKRTGRTVETRNLLDE